MKIFVLEDDDNKFAEVSSVILKKTRLETPVITRADNFSLAQKTLERERFDLLILDLMVPVRFGLPPEDQTGDISAMRLDQLCKNRDTPAVALTQFEDKADERIRDLNQLGITVITYSESSSDWANAIDRAVDHNEPPLQYDFVMVCALRKERNAFDSLGYEVGDEVIIDDLSCKALTLDGFKGIIIVPTRMGLVSSAIASTKAIERFRPKLIAMSGICAGFDDTAKIYDIIVPERCYQHDAGKWTDTGFIMEPYQVALETKVKLKIDRLLNRNGFCAELVNDLRYETTEIPEGQTSLSCGARTAVSSSGSSVVANDAQSEALRNYHRKGAAFEMESYALYESAESSCHKPAFFSAKCVVDNGGASKGDNFHRIACLLSAKVAAAIVIDLLK